MQLIFPIGSIRTYILSGLLLLLFSFFFHSCGLDSLGSIDNNFDFPDKLSEFGIYQGEMKNLAPSDDYHLYELSTGLFTDYAEKQRLIFLPPGTRMTPNGSDLPDFPDGTILVKTFYYFNDKSDMLKGKNVIETRLLIKEEALWNVAAYIWNEEQEEAFFSTSGLNKLINWTDQTGMDRAISYRIPNQRECATCHKSYSDVKPIGPKLRNLNIQTERDGVSINQLQFLQDIHYLETTDPSQLTALPSATDQNVNLQERGRAYLDVNCAHCHSPGGYASSQGLDFTNTTSIHDTGIYEGKRKIERRMESGRMPLIGTSVLDAEGVELIKKYLKEIQ